MQIVQAAGTVDPGAAGLDAGARCASRQSAVASTNAAAGRAVQLPAMASARPACWARVRHRRGDLLHRIDDRAGTRYPFPAAGGQRAGPADAFEQAALVVAGQARAATASDRAEQQAVSPEELVNGHLQALPAGQGWLACRGMGGRLVTNRSRMGVLERPAAEAHGSQSRAASSRRGSPAGLRHQHRIPPPVGLRIVENIVQPAAFVPRQRDCTISSAHCSRLRSSTRSVVTRKWP